jgi:hypothetical protein
MSVLWQGIHICVDAKCAHCGSNITEDLKVGPALYMPCQVDVCNNRLFSDARVEKWFGMPLLESLRSPKSDIKIELKVEKFFVSREIIILNCIDFLYGHSILKLLNAEHHLEENAEFGLVVIVPKFLRWMVPKGVAEIWTVDIPLSRSQHYYPALHARISDELERFEVVYVSYAHSHPKHFDITRFTGVEKHNFEVERFRITFIWREDRPWWNNDLSLRAARKFAFMKPLLYWQNGSIRQLFSRLRRKFQQATFTVAGLGTSTRFPAWIEDCRVGRFTDELERQTCKIYTESRLVVGVHGSNMLLPSAHAGLTLDLMPSDRWANLAQDILYQEADNRLAAFRYRFLPLVSSPALVSHIASTQLKGFSYFRDQMLNRENV